MWVFWVVLVLLLICLVIIYNSLISSKNLVKEAFSTMDVYLKKRWDLIPNLVETVKEYAKYEEGTLSKITSLRAGKYDSISQDEKISINEEITRRVI